ncbi:hypothetical protein DFH06DRAFT_1021170, partial [Mycena polygramma]
VVCPEAPSWFAPIFEEVSREEAPASYWELLRAWVELETSTNFVQRGSLPKGICPDQVSAWVRDGRGRTVEVQPIDDVGKFETEWWAWWTSLQPEWRGFRRGRRKPGEVEAVPDGADWGRLASAGKNGVLSVVAALYWWACAEAEEGNGSSGGWEEAVADTTWVIRAMKS